MKTVTSEEKLPLPSELSSYEQYEDSNSYSKDIDRFRRHDHGGGEDGDDWLDDSEIEEDWDRGVEKHQSKLDRVNQILKDNGYKPNAEFDLGEKGHFSINFNLELDGSKPKVKEEKKKEPYYNYFPTPNAVRLKSEILSHMADVFKTLAREYKQYEEGNSSSPSGPDTSKFKAIHHGMIEYFSGDSVYGDYYTPDRFASAGIKIGFNVESGIKKEIGSIVKSEYDSITLEVLQSDKSIPRDAIEEFRKGLKESKPIRTINIYDGDNKYKGYQILFFETFGSGWGCYAVEVKNKKEDNYSYVK